jgi:hypothetical protein
MANAGVPPQGGNLPPQGWDSAERARLRSARASTFGNSLEDAYGYNPKDADYYANVDNGMWYASPEAPAKLTDLPTSSLNSAKPRTVAAGYDVSRGVMTVVFRDGTVYNYYQVTEGEWLNFHDSVSKGRPWLNKYGPGTPGLFIGKPQGPADMSGVDPAIAEEIYLTAATAQQRYKTKRRYKTGNVTAAGQPVMRTRVPKAALSRAGLKPNSRASQGGTNPAQHKGTNPNQK